MNTIAGSANSAWQAIPLAGRSLRLQPFGEGHLRNPVYLGWLRDRDVVRTLNLPEYYLRPVALEAVEAWCRRLWASGRDLLYAIEIQPEETFVGTVKLGGIDSYSGTADVGIMLGRRDLWGRGIATDAIATLCADAFDRLGLRRLTAGAMANNPAMIRVFEKLGFQREGCLRGQDRLDDCYIDHIYLGCLREEFVAPAGQGAGESHG